jgi:hypothetical protein
LIVSTSTVFSHLCVCISFHHKANWSTIHLSFNNRERLKIQHVKEEGVNQWIDNTEHTEVTVHKASTSNRLEIPFTKPVQWYLLMSLQFVLCLNDIVNKMENTSLPLFFDIVLSALLRCTSSDITLVINHSTQWSRYVSVYQ